MKTRLQLAIAATCTAILLSSAAPALACSGTDGGFGYSWRDLEDGASVTLVPFDMSDQMALPDNGPPIGPIDLPWPFPFYGGEYTQLWISDNGWISLGDPMGDSFATPATLPGCPAAPPGIIAPLWNDLLAEGTASRFVKYGPGGAASAYRIQMALWDDTGLQALNVDVQLFPDGRIKFRYRTETDTRGGTIGVQSVACDDGMVVQAGPVPGCSSIFNGQVIEFLPPPLLIPECGTFPPIACGTTNGMSPAPAGRNVLFYCSDEMTRWDAQETVYAFDLAEASEVTLTLSGTTMSAFLLDGCNERQCVQSPIPVDTPTTLLLGAGSYLVVVDGPTAADEGAFTLDLQCQPLGTPLTCGNPDGGSTIGQPSRWDSYPCAMGVDLSGAEQIHSVSIAMNTNLTVNLDTGDPPADVLILRPDAGEITGEECVAWGDAGAVAWNADPGEYLIVIDGVAGGETDYTISTSCEVGLDCGSPAGTIDFGTGRVQAVAGDNSAGNNFVQNYNCVPGEVFPGPEQVWEVVLDQPGLVAVVQTDGTPLDFFFLTNCNEGSCVGAAGGSSCSSELEPGTYWLVVDSASGDSGPYELLLIYEEVFNRWSECELPVTPDTELDTESSPFWHLSDQAFCKYWCTDMTTCWPGGAECPDMSECLPQPQAIGVECSFAMYVTVDCGTEINLPLFDCEGGHIRIFDVFNGEYLTLNARSPTWAHPPSDEIMWQDLDCAGGSDPRWNEVVTNVSFERPEGLCGVFRLEFINHSGNVWELFANCDGSRTPAFNISDSLCTALAGYNPLPNLSIVSVDEVYNCPDVTITAEIRNDGCTPATDVEIVLRDGADIVTDVIPEILPGETVLHVFDTPVPTPSVALQVALDPNDTVLECDEPGAASRSACAPNSGLDIVNLLGCAASCVVDVRGNATPNTICSDGVSPITLDMCSTLTQACPSGLEYAYVEIGSGDMPMWGAECSWVIDPPPAMDTSYSLAARCIDEPDTCNDFLVVDVDVQRRPDFDPATVMARDRTNCNQGILVTWEEATFYGPGGTGVYNVYRSEVGCDTGLTLLRLGLTELELQDTPPLPDTPYYYVVEAEDDTDMSSCLPRGPNNGGSTTRVSANGGACTEIIDLFAQDLAGLPRIGESLRVGGTDPMFGSRQYGPNFVQMFWTPDRPADPLSEEHFHVYRSDKPDTGFSSITDDAPAISDPEFLDPAATLPNDGNTHLWHYLIFSSDGCEGENIDYELFCTYC